MSFQLLYSKQWWKTTLLVLMAVGVMVRLGIWQLDRLAQRRAFNTMVATNQAKPQLDLQTMEIDSDLTDMEYRSVRVSGVYDHEHQVALRNQVFENQLGVHLLTPLHISGSDQYVIVDRGWVPFEAFTNNRLDQYNEAGLVQVTGVIRLSDEREEIIPEKRVPANPDENTVVAMKFANLRKIEELSETDVLPIYIQQAPDSRWDRLPRRVLPDLDLTEGPHLGYAIQWFIFAGLLGFGYPFYVNREESRLQPRRKSQVRPYLQIMGSGENEISGKREGDVPR